MFVLRFITGDGVVHNVVLGKKYSVCYRARAPKEFDILKDEFDAKNSADAYAIIKSEASQKILVFPYNSYYVMTAKGDTFESL